MSNEITKFNPTKFNPATRPLTGLAAKKAAIAAELAKTQPEVNEPKIKSPDEVEHRIGIVFDDSGSMLGDRLKNAKLGVEEFLRSCSKDNTSVCVYPMNHEGIRLTTNLPAVALYINGIFTKGGTPLLQTLKKMRETNPSLTRAIVFSDGAPDDSRFENYGIPKEWNLVVDTVFIGSYGEEFMVKLAKITGGIFLKFDPAKSNFATAFKYLSPGLRYMLADKSFVAKLEGK